MTKTNVNPKLQKMVLMAILIAIIFLMAFTPLGYLKTAGLEITFILIPVVVGAVSLGPSAGAVLGTVFGITSFIQCFGLSAFGTELLGINPIGTFVSCLVPRILCGYLSGLIFYLLQKVDKTKFLGHGVACVSGAIINTTLFMTSLVIFFWNTDFFLQLKTTFGANDFFSFVLAFVGINGLIEAIVCAVVGTAVAKAVTVFQSKYKK